MNECVCDVHECERETETEMKVEMVVWGGFGQKYEKKKNYTVHCGINRNKFGSSQLLVQILKTLIFCWNLWEVL